MNEEVILTDRIEPQAAFVVVYESSAAASLSGSIRS
jgi:hypothetical protein